MHAKTTTRAARGAAARAATAKAAKAAKAARPARGPRAAAAASPAAASPAAADRRVPDATPIDGAPARAPRAAAQSRDPEATKAAILAAATEEFARHGVGGARVDRIAEAADINKRMLYYYFGNKDALFLAVLEAEYRRIRDAERALNLTEVDPVEGVRRLVAFTMNYHVDRPQFIRLLNSENLHRAEHLKQSTQIRAMHSPLVAMIDDLLERGRRAGVFRAGVDPVQLYVSIASLSYFYLSNRHTLSTIFGRDLTSPRERAERLSHMIDLVLGYLLRN